MSLSLIAKRLVKPISNTMVKAVYSRSMMDAQQAFFEEQKKEMGRFQHRIITNRGYIHPEEL